MCSPGIPMCTSICRTVPNSAGQTIPGSTVRSGVSCTFLTFLTFLTRRCGTGMNIKNNLKTPLYEVSAVSSQPRSKPALKLLFLLVLTVLWGRIEVKRCYSCSFLSGNSLKQALTSIFPDLMTFPDVSGVFAEMHGFDTFLRNPLKTPSGPFLPLNQLPSKLSFLLVLAVFSSSREAPRMTATRRDQRSRPTRGLPHLLVFLTKQW